VWIYLKNGYSIKNGATSSSVLWPEKITSKSHDVPLNESRHDFQIFGRTALAKMLTDMEFPFSNTNVQHKI
jgi:hypothetical protein